MSRLQALSELIPGYPADAPQTGPALYHAPYDDLPDIAKDLRRHFVTLQHSLGRKPIPGPEAAMKMLVEHHLATLARKWVTYPLDGENCRVLVPTKHGARWQRYESSKVPKPDKLAESCPLPEGGKYLVIYGGSPEILSVKDSHGGGVAEDLRNLQVAARTTDVLFWHLAPGQAPALYSLLAGAGDRGGELVEFPDPAALALAKGTTA